MSGIIIPRWHDLAERIQGAESQITIFAPYFSENGILVVEANTSEQVGVQFWTRLSLFDWANRYADPESLLSFLREVNDRGNSAELCIQRKLHAKAYFTDEHSALVGSANFTSGGFENNIELLVRLDTQYVADTLQTLLVASQPNVKSLTCDELAGWIQRYRSVIDRFWQRSQQAREELNEAQGESDEEFAPTADVGAEPDQARLAHFVEWLAQHREYPGAAYLVDLHSDKVVQRRQRHVKQCFAGVFRFLHHDAAWIQRLADAVTDGDGIYEPDDQLIAAWTQYLEEHENDSNELYSFKTLRALMRPNLGGTLAGQGGGASGTLKRIFPLVARYLSDPFGS